MRLYLLLAVFLLIGSMVYSASVKSMSKRNAIDDSYILSLINNLLNGHPSSTKAPPSHDVFGK